MSVNKSIWRKPWFYLALFAGGILAAVGLYQIPAINDKAYYYVAKAQAKVFYFFKPPAQVVFSPTQQGTMAAQVAKTLTAMVPTRTMTPTITPTMQVSPTPTQTPQPTKTPVPPPPSAKVEGVKWEKQGFNNCGPANLAMILTYWGNPATQRDTEKVLKPRKEDRNVMPYEMLRYVQEKTPLQGIVRYGGNMEILKRFIAAGFPVVIERGYMDAKEGWMGHYGIVYAYDDAKQQVQIPDSYIGEIKMSYADVEMYWAHFDDIYLVVYPPEREQEVMDILGPNFDSEYNLRAALEQVERRIYNVEGRELFFAWYSRGSIMVELQDYIGAAESYDKAFEVYAKLVEAQRPWRILWYQTGPYFAYFYSGRYFDTLNLARQTLDRTPEDAIPETFIWAGRASRMLGDDLNAEYYFRRALEWHPNWWIAIDELKAMGETP